jgi:glutathione peroxidase
MTERRRIHLLGGFAALLALGGTRMSQAETTAAGPVPAWRFDSIYGGAYASGDFAGKAILLVNTASLCGFTPQYTALQQLQDAYKDRGLVVFAVPSDDFHQEKASNGEVKEFCELNYGITLPMAVISHVKGPEAHPLFVWLRDAAGYVPQWNFNKVLIDRSGHVAGMWPSGDDPMGGVIEAAVVRALAG